MRRLSVVVVALAVLAVASACTLRGADAPPRPAAEKGEAGSIPINWDQPIIGATTVSRAEDASALVTFLPVVPRGLPPASKAMASRSADAMALVFTDVTVGRYVLIERNSGMSQTQLESLAKSCDPGNGCQGRWTLTTIRNGITALSITGGPTTGLMWIEGGVTFDLYGPADTMTPAMVAQLANKI